MSHTSRGRASRLDPVGLACAAGGASLWGLSFVVPLLMPGVSAWDVSLGRYLTFGAIGSVFVARARAAGFTLTARQWGSAFLFAITGYYGCYTALVTAIDLSGPALATLVMGLTPVSVAVAGNLRTREVPFVRLLPPIAVMGAGLALVNLARHGVGFEARNLVWGMLAAILALALLTHYLVANILFLKRNPQVTPLAWANATGCALMAFAACALGVRLLRGGGPPWAGTPTSAVGYAAGSLVLGLGVSWLGGALWNKANARLPATVAGQCIVFWPVSGIVYACLIQRELPGVWEVAGMALVFTGVLWGLKAARPK